MIQYNRSTGILETQVYGRIRSHPFSLILTAQHGPRFPSWPWSAAFSGFNSPTDFATPCVKLGVEAIVRYT